MKQSRLTISPISRLEQELSNWICTTSKQAISVVAVKTHPVKSLHPDEEIYIARAVSSRRADFAAGRYCGHQALARLGIPDQPILVGDKGEPIWPNSIVGSITHDQNIAVAVVAPASAVYAIGIDLLALSHCIDSSVSTLIASQSELDGIENIIFDSGPNLGIGDDYVNPLLLAFSAKESAIKLVSPLLNLYLDYRDIKLICDGKIIRAQFVKLNKCLSIHWHIFSHMIFTFTAEQQ